MFEVFHNVGFANSLMVLVPAVIVLVVVYKQDKIEEESKLLLAFLIFLGVLSGFLTSKIGSPIATTLTNVIPENHLFFIIINDFLITAVLEEGLKYWSLKLPTWNSSEFDCRFDGIVYGACVGVGFAIHEAFSIGGQAEFSLMVIRSLSSITGHFSYGVLMGLFYGIARAIENNGNERKSKLYRNLSFAIPWLLHGSYDFITDLASHGVGSLAISFAFAGIVLVVAVIVLKISSKKDVRI